MRMRALALAFGLLVAAPQAVGGATFLVDSESAAPDAIPGDGSCASALGGCTLPAAIEEANALGGHDTIELPPGDFPVQRHIDGDVAIIGSGAFHTSIGPVEFSGRVELLSLSTEVFVYSDGAPVLIGEDASFYRVVFVTGEGGRLVFRQSQADEVVLAERTIGKRGLPCGGNGYGAPDGTFVNSTIGLLRDWFPWCTVRGAPISIVHSTVGELDAFKWASARSIVDHCVVSTGGSVATSSEFTIDTDGSCGLSDPTDLPSMDPMLGPLTDNGGPTLTQLPMPGSPAIDAIPRANCVWDDDGDPNTPEIPLVLDQRGVERPQGTGCDIGAVESVAICGDGVIEGDEECDEGNLDPFDGCDAQCALECGNGMLDPAEVCDDGNTVEGDGCSADCSLVSYCAPTPQPGCVIAEKASLRLDERRAAREKLKATLRSLAPLPRPGSFGSPISGETAYDLCVYDEADVLRGALHVDRAGDTCGSGPCWTLMQNGIKYTDHQGAADGVRKLAIKRGGTGKLLLRAKNSANQDAMPTGIAEALEGHTSATVQMVTSDASCVEATLDNVTKADGAQFKAKAR